MSVTELVRDFLDLDDIEEVWAREYLRVSKDESGRARSNREQHDDLVAHAERKRWHLAEPYEDIGSASNRRKHNKRRADFDQLMADLRGGTFGAHVLMIWEPSRGSREVPEWYALLGLCQQQRVFIFVMNLRRVFNPRVARDWKDLMNMAVDAEHEVMQLVERQERANNADAKAGLFGGGRRPYGYASNGIVVVPEEADVIRDCVAAVLAGVPVRRIAADLNERGIPTAYGNRWHPGPLANLLASPRIAGKRVHHGVVVKDNAWPHIIDEVTHKRVVAVLRTRSPVGRRGRTPWLLTGLVACERCQASLVGNTDTRGVRRYICRSGPGQAGCGGLVISAAPLEETLGVLVAERAADTEARGAADLGPDDGDERAELDRLAVLRAEAAEDRAAGGDRVAYNDLIAALARRQREVEARLATKVRTTVQLDLVDDGRPWEELTDTEKRRRLDAFIDRIKIGPATKRGSTSFERGRVTAPGRISWKV